MTATINNNTNTADIDTRWENAEFVATTNMDEDWGNESVEVRKESDGSYIAKWWDEDGEHYDLNYDYQKVLDYQRDAISGFWDGYAESLIEQTADGRKYTLNEDKLSKLLDKMTDHACEEYAEYALQYYYIDSEGLRKDSADPDKEALVAFCLGGDEDECILSCVTFEED